MADFTDQYLGETAEILAALDRPAIQGLIAELAALRRRGGRLFILGVGGSAANASHAVNDFRKICAIEAYAPTDNVGELTARTNDEGWETVFVDWLKGSRLAAGDALLIFSVGGGNRQRNISVNLVHAVDHAKSVGARVLGLVGSEDGHTAREADHCVIVPAALHAHHRTPHTEGLSAVLWHLMVSHPDLKSAPTKWESLD